MNWNTGRTNEEPSSFADPASQGIHATFLKLCTLNRAFFVPGKNDNVGGTVAATADTLLTAIDGVSGTGNLAVFTFDAIRTGTNTIGIQNETLLDSSLNVIADGTTGGSVTVTSATATAPEIDSASAWSSIALLLGGVAVMRGRRKCSSS